jgi:hypothetical protein
VLSITEINQLIAAAENELSDLDTKWAVMIEKKKGSLF